MLVALLDTCVLWPSLQRDFLLSLAFEGIYRPVWSSQILKELEYGETLKLIKRGGADPDVAAERAAHLVATMRSGFEDAEVSGWHSLVGTYELPDPDDEHVLAAAVIAGAGTLVTANTVELNPVAARRAVDEIAGRSGRHGRTLTFDEVLDLLVHRYGMGAAVRCLR